MIGFGQTRKTKTFFHSSTIYRFLMCVNMAKWFYSQRRVHKVVGFQWQQCDCSASRLLICSLWGKHCCLHSHQNAYILPLQSDNKGGNDKIVTAYASLQGVYVETKKKCKCKWNPAQTVRELNAACLIYYPLFNLKLSNSTDRLPEEMNLIIPGKNLCHCLILFLVIIIII